MSEDHTPSVLREKARIEANGGTVKIYSEGPARINGRLAVSRGFGDLAYKDAVNFKGKISTAEPDIAKVPITTKTQFLILACDGFWDTVTNQEAVDFVLHRLHYVKSATLYNICIDLTTLAFNNGSTDNISIVLVAFDHSRNFTTHASTNSPARFGLRPEDPLPETDDMPQGILDKENEKAVARKKDKEPGKDRK